MKQIMILTEEHHHNLTDWKSLYKGHS